MMYLRRREACPELLRGPAWGQQNDDPADHHPGSVELRQQRFARLRQHQQHEDQQSHPQDQPLPTHPRGMSSGPRAFP